MSFHHPRRRTSRLWLSNPYVDLIGRWWGMRFNAERGFWFTMRGFLVAPRVSFEGYLGRDRKRYNNPLKMVIFLSAIAAIAMHHLQAADLLQIREGQELSPEQKEATAFTQRNYNLLLLSALPMMALVTRLFYWRRIYNFLEHLALNAFEVSVITAVYLLMLPSIVLWPVANLVYVVVALVYQIWLYRRVLGPGWFRAIAATVTVTIVYMGSMTVVGFWLAASL